MLTHSSGAQMPLETSKKRPSQLPEGLSNTYKDSLLSSLSHCILPVNLNLAIFRIQHKALVPVFLYYHLGLYLRGCYSCVYFPVSEGA